MSNASGSTCPWKRPLQDLRPFSGRLPPCGCRSLGEEAVGGLRACRSRLRKQRTGVGDQSQSEWRGSHRSGHPHTPMSLPVQKLHRDALSVVVLVMEAQLPADLHMEFLYNFADTAGCCSTHLLRVSVSRRNSNRSVTLWNVMYQGCEAVTQEGTDFPRDTLKCSLISTTSKTKLNTVLKFYPEASGRWPSWPYPWPQFLTIHDTLLFCKVIQQEQNNFYWWCIFSSI